jgi:glycoside/pentoside/hexuronide:cation symporter, GPH family
MSLRASTRRGYALGSVATGTFGTVPGLLLLPYLTDSLGIAAGLAGVIVFAPKAWDVVLNPIAGRISDRSDSPRGRRRPFLLRGGVALAVAFALLFAGPTAPPLLAGGWVVVLFLACATAYAFFQVPYVAMPAEITADPAERTRLMTWRVVVLALAILLSGATAPLVVAAFGYPAMGVYIGLVLLAGVVGAYSGTRDAPTGPSVPSGGSLRDQLRVVAADADYRWLLVTFVVQALGVGAMLAGVAYVARYLIADPAAASVLFAAFIGPALLVTPLWERFAGRYGKRTGYTLSSAVLAVGALGLWSAGGGFTVAVYVAAAVAGIGYAGAQVFPLAMLPDIAAAGGPDRIGLYTGVWTAGETLGLALGPGLYAVVLQVGGYAASTDGTAAAQSPTALTAIAVGFSVVPAVLVAASLSALRHYRLDERSAGVA